MNYFLNCSSVGEIFFLDCGFHRNRCSVFLLLVLCYFLVSSSNPRSIECRETKTKVSQARENAGDQVAIGFGSTSDWLRMVAGVF